MRETMHEKAARLRVIVRDGRTLIVGDHGEYDLTDGDCRCTAARYRRLCSHITATRMHAGQMGGVA